MCTKSSKNSSFLLNPSAQEWRPAQPHVIFTPKPRPAAAAPLPHTVQVLPFAAVPRKLPWQFPPQLPCFDHPLYFQGFIPYGQCTRPLPLYHFIPFSFAEAGSFCEAVPIFGGVEKEYVAGPEEKMMEDGNSKVDSPIVQNRERNSASVGKTCFSPPMWRSMRSLNVGDEAPRRRQEWRPRKSDSDNAVVGGYATPLPPCNSASKQLSDAPPCEKLTSSSKTTVMIRNIPNQLRRDFMLEFVDHYCKAYSMEYDFLYLPMDFSKEDNLGYAFVNFTTTAAAMKFKKILKNYRWGTIKTERGSFTSKKICEITWAAIQGREGLVKRFQNSIFSCDKLEFLPVVLDPPRNGSNTDLARPVVVGKLRQQSKIF